jgi:hypothetical protein
VNFDATTMAILVNKATEEKHLKKKLNYLLTKLNMTTQDSYVATMQYDILS